MSNASESQSTVNRVAYVESLAAAAAEAVSEYYGLAATREELVSLFYHALWPTQYPGVAPASRSGLQHQVRVRRALDHHEGQAPYLTWWWRCVCGAHSAISRDARTTRAEARAHGAEKFRIVGGGNV
jgi:hypothetical protein